MKKRGFTLIEILVVVFIIGLLASIIVVIMDKNRAAARDARRKADLRTIQNALESYYAINQVYPLWKTTMLPPNGKNCSNMSNWSYAERSWICYDTEIPNKLGETNKNFLKDRLVPLFFSNVPIDPNTDRDRYYAYVSTIDKDNIITPVKKVSAEGHIGDFGGKQNDGNYCGDINQPREYTSITHPGYYLALSSFDNKKDPAGNGCILGYHTGHYFLSSPLSTIEP